jgi:Zn finger protein HypA/HybF involved in hydrogenase expression
MHEASLVRDLVRQVEAVAIAEGAVKVTGLTVRAAENSHVDQDHLQMHLDAAARGTLLEGARVTLERTETSEDDVTDPYGLDLYLVSIDVEET